jgi:hypothetical protein
VRLDPPRAVTLIGDDGSRWTVDSVEELIGRVERATRDSITLNVSYVRTSRQSSPESVRPGWAAAVRLDLSVDVSTIARRPGTTELISLAVVLAIIAAVFAVAAATTGG